MPLKLTRLRSYKLLKEVYGDRPHPDFKKYEIYDLRKAVKCWYEFDGETWVRI